MKTGDGAASSTCFCSLPLSKGMVASSDRFLYNSCACLHLHGYGIHWKTTVNMSELLEHYINEALLQLGQTPRSPIFRPSNNPPQVIRNAVNHIILYPGAFNPPHVGHLGVLQHVLLHHGCELNIVAAMVCPSGDEYVEHKNRRTDERFVTSQKDRCALWQEDARFPNNAFTWKKSTIRVASFVEKLIEIAGEDGVQIRFVSLYGAEKLRRSGGLGNWEGLCQDAITSDFSRAHEHFSSSGLAQIQGFDSWTLVSQEPACEGRLLRSGTFTPCPEQGPVTDRVWRCMSIETPHCKTYLVARTRSRQSSSQGEGVSSTRIRQSLREKRGAELVSALSEMALSPYLLLNKITKGAICMDRNQWESIKRSLVLSDTGDEGDNNAP